MTATTPVRTGSRSEAPAQSPVEDADSGLWQPPAVSPSSVAVRSQHCRSLTLGDRTMVYNALFGKALLGSSEVGEVLRLFETQHRLSEVASDLEIPVDELIGLLQPFFEKSILVDPATDERGLLRLQHRHLAERIQSDDISRFGSVALMVTMACNFACPHCVSSHTDAGDTTKTMTIDTARAVVDSVLTRARELGREKFNVNFGGGEPLLNWQVVLGVMEYIAETYPDIRMSHSCNTNVALVTDEIASAFKRFEVGVSPSLDGSQAANDAIRIDKNGDGTFHQILRGLSILQTHGVRVYGISATVVDGNFDLIDESFLDCVAKLGFNSVRLEPDMIADLNRPVSEIVDRLVHLVYEGRKRGIRVEGRWTLPFRRLTDPANSGAHSLTNCSAQAGGGFSVDPSGMVRMCGFAAETVCHIGDWNRVRTSDGQIERLRQRWLPDISVCHGCSLEGICKGGCMVTFESCQMSSRNELYQVASAEPSPLGFRCELYRQATERLLNDRLAELSSGNS